MSEEEKLFVQPKPDSLYNMRIEGLHIELLSWFNEVTNSVE
jgi:hypothetical protein